MLHGKWNHVFTYKYHCPDILSPDFPVTMQAEMPEQKTSCLTHLNAGKVEYTFKTLPMNNH